MACTEPEPAPAPLSGTFAVDGQFTTQVMKTFVASPSGVTERHDTTAVDGPVFGKITFDQLLESTSSKVKVGLGYCEYCIAPTGYMGQGSRVGDSVKVSVGLTPNYQLLGVHNGDSITGRIESTSSGSGPSGSYVRKVSGTFVARRSQPDAEVTFTLRGLFDSVRMTNGQGGSTITATADSIRGPLTMDDFTTAPIADLTVEKCGPSCFGRTAAVPASYDGYTGAGYRRGDSVAFTLMWDLMAHIEVKGVYLGDSISGSIRSTRSTSTSTIYTGRFVARRP